MIELMVVLTVMAVLSGMAIVSFRRAIQRQALETATVKVREALAMAKSLSMDKNGGVCARFERKKAAVFGEGIEEALAIPRDVEVVKTTFHLRRTGEGVVCFSKNGAPSPAGRVVLENREGEQREIIVALGSGRIRVRK